LPSSPPAASFRRASLHDLRRESVEVTCSVCGEPIDDDARDAAGPESGADGSLAWSRGDRVDVERVPQCSSCASALAYTMFRRWDDEDDGG